MDKLWAPWRMDYISTPKEKGCVFCNKSKSKEVQKSLVLYKAKKCFVLMNLYPYTNGHLMISPFKHTSDTNDLSNDCNLEIMTLANECFKILKKNMKAEGFNFGLNLGKIGGAGIEKHIHYHIVPRWLGDNNFMPTVGNTRIIMQGLEETWARLKPDFDKLRDSHVA